MLGFEYHLDTCIGCGACQVACQDAHHLLSHEYFRKVVFVEKLHRYVSMSCNHCQEAACVKKCETGAMYIKEGVVLHNDSLCIGCGECQSVCPYQAISLSEKYGWAQKCDSCYEARQQGKLPVCVASCPTHSLLFKEIKERNDLGLGQGNTLPNLCIVGDIDEKI
ncbi:MAG: 4Fe-4S dicluster domain-containing protein [Bacillota bacterium]|nr:4Fe-4S dicluster domain-containing protein [Bacillota bacterium]